MGEKPPQKFAYLFNVLQHILQGYDNQVIMQSSLKDLVKVLRDPELPYGEWNAQASALHTRMPAKLDAALSQIVERAHQRGVEFPAKQLAKAFSRFMEENVSPGDGVLLQASLAPLVEVMNAYTDGLKVHEYTIMIQLLEQFYAIEKQFATRTSRDEEVILDEPVDSGVRCGENPGRRKVSRIRAR